MYRMMHSHAFASIGRKPPCAHLATHPAAAPVSPQVCHLGINTGPQMLRTLQGMGPVLVASQRDVVEFNIGLW